MANKIQILAIVLLSLISISSIMYSLFYDSISFKSCDTDYYGESSLAVTYSPKPGDKVSSPIKVSGCSRSFESVIHYKLVARDGTVLAEGGELSGGGVNGPGLFSLEIKYDKTEVNRALNPALLTIEEDDPSDGEGFSPTRTVTPLLLQ